MAKKKAKKKTSVIAEVVTEQNEIHLASHSGETLNTNGTVKMPHMGAVPEIQYALVEEVGEHEIKIIKLNERIDRIVAAIDKSKSVRGL